MKYNFFDKLTNNISRAGRIIKSLPARLIFGNLQTFNRNIKPLISNNVDFKSNNEIIKKGFKKIKQKCDYDIIKKIQNKYLEYINDEEKSVFTPNKKKKFIIDPLKNIPDIKLILPFLKNELQNHYRYSFIIDQVKVWRNCSDKSYHENKQKYIYSNYWHSDQFQIDKLNVFIFLNDGVKPDTGATRILDIETTKNIIRSFKFLDTSINTYKMDKEIENKINYLEGDLGDMVIFNATRCLHAASIPKPGTVRDVIQFEIYPRKKDTASDQDYFSYSEDMYIKNLTN